MINKLKSYPKQIDNMTSDPSLLEPEYRDPNIGTGKTSGNPTLEDGKAQRVPYSRLDTSQLELI
jgi:hypothetical protein